MKNRPLCHIHVQTIKAPANHEGRGLPSGSMQVRKHEVTKVVSLVQNAPSVSSPFRHMLGANYFILEQILIQQGKQTESHQKIISFVNNGRRETDSHKSLTFF